MYQRKIFFSLNKETNHQEDKILKLNLYVAIHVKYQRVNKHKFISIEHMI